MNESFPNQAEKIPVTEQEVIDALNTNRFEDEQTRLLWDRFAGQCNKEAKTESGSDNFNVIEALQFKKLFEVLQKTKYADPNFKSFKDFGSIIGEDSEVRTDEDDDEGNRQYQLQHPDEPISSEKRDCGAEVKEFEGIVASFKKNYPVEEFRAIKNISFEAALDDPIRTAYKRDLGEINSKLSILKEQTDISSEDFEKLRAEYKSLSRALGAINSKTGEVDHTR